MPVYCGSLSNCQIAVPLGHLFAKNFAANSANVGKGEIVLFRAMEASLKAVASPPRVVVEEYHGAQHQVTFKGSGTYSRSAARCELSDLLVIVHDRTSRDARLTYIQAKSERDVVANSSGVAGSCLKANLEQWDLLANRPLIAGVGSFNPPPDLLNGAMLSSVGAFAFFLHGSAGADIYYGAASSLAMSYRYSTRAGKLTALGDVCRCAPTPECLSVYGNAEFGAFLFGMMIGTPILIAGQPASSPLGVWLAAQLRGLAAIAVASGRPADLANELADLLDPDREPAAPVPNVGATTLMLFGLTQDGRLA